MKCKCTHARCVCIPADWAIQEALKRRAEMGKGRHRVIWTVEEVKECVGGDDWANGVILAAKLIEKYEKPPVDPDLVEYHRHYVACYGNVSLDYVSKVVFTKTILDWIKDIREGKA